MKIRARLKMLEQVLALLAALLIVDVDGHPLEVEIDAVAKKQHQRDRHDDDNAQAARVAHNMQHFFAGDGDKADQAHTVRASAEELVVSETKTSSSVGRIFSILPGTSPRSRRNASMRGAEAVAS